MLSIFLPFKNAFSCLAEAAQELRQVDKLTPGSSIEFDLLKGQIEYLNSANEAVTSSYRALSQSFSSFTATVNIIFVIAVALITVITGVLTFLGFQSIKSSIDAIVQRELGKAIAQRIEGRVEYLERAAGRESILDRVEISYYLPQGISSNPAEFLAVSNRFKNVTFASKLSDNVFNSNIVVLDIENSRLTETQGIEEAKKIARKAKKWVVLVVYTSNNKSPIVDHLRSSDLPENEKIDYVPANTKVTLMSCIENAAYVSDALKAS